jgi:hypothetical protein
VSRGMHMASKQVERVRSAWSMGEARHARTLHTRGCILSISGAVEQEPRERGEAEAKALCDLVWREYSACAWSRAQSAAQAAFDIDSSDDTRAAAVSALAWLAMARGEVPAVCAALEHLPRGHRPDPLLSLTLALAEGHPARAATLAVGVEPSLYALWGPMVEAWAGLKLRALLVRLVARDMVDVVPSWAQRPVVHKLSRLGAYSTCTRVLTALFEREGFALDAYELACTESRAGNRRAALAWLRRALELGFAELAQLACDEHLAPVRALAGYRTLAARYGLPSAGAALGNSEAASERVRDTKLTQHAEQQRGG